MAVIGPDAIAEALVNSWLSKLEEQAVHHEIQREEDLRIHAAQAIDAGLASYAADEWCVHTEIDLALPSEMLRSRRSDIVLYMGGRPTLVLELKDAMNRLIGVDEMDTAWERLRVAKTLNPSVYRGVLLIVSFGADLTRYQTDANRVLWHLNVLDAARGRGFEPAQWRRSHAAHFA